MDGHMKHIVIALLLTGCAGSAPSVTTDPRPEPNIQPGSSVLTALRWVRDNAQRFDFGETGSAEFGFSRHWDASRSRYGQAESWYFDTENHGRILVLLDYTFNTDRRWHVGSVVTTYDEPPPRDYICGRDAAEQC